MQSKQKISKNAIKPIPPNLPPIPDGYVYLGKNTDFEYNGEQTKYGFAYLDGKYSDFAIRPFEEHISRGDARSHYIFPENSETVKLNLKASTPPESDGLVYWDGDKECLYVNHNGTKLKVQPPNKTFEEKLAEAKAMVGKRVSLDWDYGPFQFTPKKVKIVMEGEKSSCSAEKEAKQFGYAVCLADDETTVPYHFCIVCEEKKEDIYIGTYKIDFSRVKSEWALYIEKIGVYLDIRCFIELNKLFNLERDGVRGIRGTVEIGGWEFDKEKIKKITERIEEELK